MPTCRDIVTRALHLARIVSLGQQPTAAEAALGLECLQSFYLAHVANGMFGRLSDVARSTDCEAQAGQRITLFEGAAATLPTTRDRNGTPPFDLSLVELITPATATRAVMIYEAARAAWIDLGGLELGDEAPLASRGALHLAAALATSAGFDVAFTPDVDPKLLALARTFNAGLLNRGASERPDREGGYE